MTISMRRCNYFLLVTLLLSVFSLTVTGCSLSASYKPPYLPVKLVLDSDGNVSIVGEVSIVTFVGEFSIGAEYVLNDDPESIMVIIRNREKGTYGVDTIYRVKTNGGKFVAVLDGNTIVQVENNQVLIDVSDATVRSIQFAGVGGEIPVVEYEKDHFVVTAIKTVLVFILMIFVVFFTFFTAIIDVVLLLFGLNFPLTLGMWSFAEKVGIDWYWHHANPVGFIIGIIFLIVMVVMQMNNNR